jgi:hypothetical protein
MVRASVLVSVTALCAVAGAQAPDREGAKLFEEGRALAKEGKYAEACDRFANSLKLDPAIGTQLNYADCHEKLGRNADAWRLFDAAADTEKITNPTRAKYARERADALLPKLGIVVLQLPTPDVPGLSIEVAGRSIKPAAVIRDLVEPGPVTITVSAPNAVPFHDTQRIAAGQIVTIDVPAVETREPGPGPTVTRRRRSRVYLAYGVGGAGAVSLITGVILGMTAKSRYEEQFAKGRCMEADPAPICFPDGFEAQTAALDLATIGTVFGVAGLVLGATGAVLFVTAPRDLVITPTATSQSAGLSVVGSF